MKGHGSTGLRRASRLLGCSLDVPILNSERSMDIS